MATKNKINGGKSGAFIRTPGTFVSTQPDYIERSELVDRKATAALIKQAGQLWKALQKDSGDMSNIAVGIVNHASQLGGVLVQICGGEQMGLAFWRANCAEQLPFNFDAARELISVYKKVPEPITDFTQIWPVWKQVNMALGTLQIPERATEQQSSAVSPLTAISHLAGQATAQFEKWKQSEPLNTWPKDRLETFVVETKQIHDAHEEAAAMLKSKG